MVSPSARTATWASDRTRPTARANSGDRNGSARDGVASLHGVPRRDLGRAEFVRADEMYCHRILPCLPGLIRTGSRFIRGKAQETCPDLLLHGVDDRS